ncbi:hypothetical protein [Streptomyces sp. NPDC005435]|uniref:hypothetical protein n=1 Tax=Streptomyces sp. NPDC005435 TaxID=3154464 RepID=UPI0034552D7C
MRYLTESFLLGALRRGRGVEQFLGPCGPVERPGVRHVEVRPKKASYDVVLHTVEDAGHEGFMELVEFPPLDPDDEANEFGRLLGTTEDPSAALALAEQHTGAERDRWVNASLADAEYGDFVCAGRPWDARPDGRPWPAAPDA